MISYCVDAAIGAVGQENTYVATDSGKIADAVYCNAIMTPKECQCSSDRVAEAVKHINTDVVIDLQGDEPCITSDDILTVIALKRSVHDAVIAAYCLEKGDITNMNTPKVISYGMANDDLIYMSRQPIGHRMYKRQVGIYGFYKQQLLDMYGVDKARGEFERLEDIHILRCIDYRKRVLMLHLKGKYQSVDVKEDIPKVEEILCNRSL
jgi:CMP-2-keto-3-deoxyoctulosonic acid synthetase